jgi:hypothetical protein
MADANRKLWLEAMDEEIQNLERMECWDIIPWTQANTRVIPSSMWVYQQIGYPDCLSQELSEPTMYSR